MARKRKKPTQSTNVSLESTARRLNSLLLHPDIRTWMYSGGAQGVRSKLLRINFNMLRRTIERVPLIQAIINTRIDQLVPFCTPVRERDQRGFDIVPIDPDVNQEDPKVKKDIALLSSLIKDTGFTRNPDREDDFIDYMQMQVREVLTIDQIATEIQYNRLNQPTAFWALDGAYIKRTTPYSKYPENVRFVQEVDEKIYNIYTNEDLVFDYKHKRVDMRYRGYGYSPVEQAIDIITTLLFGYNHIRDQFIRNRIPKGFISVMGDVGEDQINSIQRYWYSAMSGAGGQWNIPVLPSGKEGIGLDFKMIGQSNRDMEYHKLMMFISSVCSAVFAIDMAEMGMKSDDSSPLIGEKTDTRMSTSRDRGMSSLLTFFQQHINKVLQRFTADYEFQFVGYDIEEEIKRTDLMRKRLESTMTVNELREHDGMDPIEEDYADVVLNPQAVQIYNAAKQAEQMQQMGGGFGENGEGDEGAEGDENSGEPEEEDWENLFKARSEDDATTVTIE